MGPRSIAINHPDERPGDECSEDRLETEVRREHDEEPEDQKGTTYADLRGGVLEA